MHLSSHRSVTQGSTVSARLGDVGQHWGLRLEEPNGPKTEEIAEALEEFVAMERHHGAEIWAR